MSAIEHRRTANGWRIRWNETLARDARAQGWWTDRTAADALLETAASDPGRVLLIEGSSRVTAAQLAAQAQQLARAMLSRAAPGSVISFMLPNWHEAAAIYFGASLAGMVAHPILPSLRDHDLRFMLADVGSKMVFVPGEWRGFDYAAMLARVTAELPNPPEVVVLRGAPDSGHGPHIAYVTLSAETHNTPLAALDADDVRMVMYTSGTTGRPKGVLHTHNTIAALIAQIGAHWLVDRGDRWVVPSPISHIGGSIYAFEMPVLLGTRAVLMERWDAAEAVALMDAHQITHMAGATPFLRGLLDAAKAAGTRLPHLKLFICGGASVPPALIREAAEWFEKAVVSRVYGSTEVPVTTVGVISRDDIAHAAQTDGRPGIATVKLAEDSEIRAIGPQMLVGYVHEEDEASAFDAEGFYRTGDQGAWIDDCLTVTGRIKDLIIRNGENIAPKEIEDLLMGHPAIAEIAIVGLPDPRTGERAVAVIVPRDGNAAPDVAQLGAFLGRLGMAKFKVPEAVASWPTLPKNDAGKVLKAAIRETLLAGEAQ